MLAKCFFFLEWTIEEYDAGLTLGGLRDESFPGAAVVALEVGVTNPIDFVDGEAADGIVLLSLLSWRGTDSPRGLVLNTTRLPRVLSETFCLPSE